MVNLAATGTIFKTYYATGNTLKATVNISSCEKVMMDIFYHWKANQSSLVYQAQTTQVIAYHKHKAW